MKLLNIMCVKISENHLNISPGEQNIFVYILLLRDVIMEFWLVAKVGHILLREI